jgi:hypothetical protein
MVKGLKVVMIVYAIIGILFGLAFIMIPDQMSDWFNVATVTGFPKYILTLLATTFIVVSVFLIMAARDPIRNILWVKFAIAHAIVDALVVVYAMIRDYGDFSQIGVALIIHVVFAILLLIYYPWKGQASS